MSACELDQKLCTTTASADTTVKQECWEVPVVERSCNRNSEDYLTRTKADDTSGKPVGIIGWVAKKEVNM